MIYKFLIWVIAIGLNAQEKIISKLEVFDIYKNSRKVIYEKDIHWFTFIKANGELYFAGETKELCIKAAAKITQKYFFIPNKDFYELQNKVETLNELGKEVLENEYIENAEKIFGKNQNITDK